MWALPYGRAYYWKTLDVQEVELTAQGHYSFLLPILCELTGGKLLKINSFTTDTCSTMRATYRLLRATPKLAHYFITLCNSHSLQLLIKDIIELPQFLPFYRDTTIVITAFSTSKKQWARV
jgi:hypothetical protein